MKKFQSVKGVAPLKAVSGTAAKPAKMPKMSGRIANLGDYAHAPKGKKR